MKSHRLIALFALSLGSSCVSGIKSHEGTLERYVFNGLMETIDYEVHQSLSSHRVVAMSMGRDRIWETETKYEFVSTSEGTRQSNEVLQGRILPPKTTLVGSEAYQLRIESDKDTIRTSQQVDLAIHLEPPLAYLSLIRRWDELGRPEKLALFDGATAFDLAIEIGPSVSVNGESLQAFKIDSGLGEDYVFLNADSRLIAVVAGPFDIVDVEWRESLGAMKEAVTAEKLRENGTVYREALLRRGNYLLRGGTVVDVRSGRLVEDATVEVEDGEIVDVRTTDPNEQSDAPVVDVSGKFLVPGLFDMHGHVYYTEQAINYLAGGVTVVREMGGDLEKKVTLRDAFHGEEHLGPDMYLFGLVDGDTPATFGNIRLSSPEDVAAVAERFESLGLHGFKIYGELDSATFREIGNEAGRRGLQMAGHLPRQVSMSLALELGMEHFSHFVTTSEDESVRENARLVARHGAWVDPTRAWSEILNRPFDLSLSTIDSQSEFWTDALKREVSAFGVDVPPGTWEERFDGIMDDLRIYVEEGVQLLPGTDVAAGVSTLHRELELFVQFGLSNLEALRSATLEAAQALGVEGSLGSIEVGKVADLLVLDENPLESVDALRRPSLVAKDGDLLDVKVLRRYGSFINQ